jgi:DNA-binding transcriptional MerR regulator
MLELPEKLYYSIGEVAKAFEVNTSLIRFWEGEFEILKPKKNKKGDRFFTTEDIKNLRLIYHLVKEKGYTINGANDVLKNQKDIVKQAELIQRLEAIKNKLIELKSALGEKEEFE